MYLYILSVQSSPRPAPSVPNPKSDQERHQKQHLLLKLCQITMRPPPRRPLVTVILTFTFPLASLAHYTPVYWRVYLYACKCLFVCLFVRPLITLLAEGK